MRITVGYGDPARGQVRKLLRPVTVTFRLGGTVWAAIGGSHDDKLEVSFRIPSRAEPSRRRAYARVTVTWHGTARS